VFPAPQAVSIFTYLRCRLKLEAMSRLGLNWKYLVLFSMHGALSACGDIQYKLRAEVTPHFNVMLALAGRLATRSGHTLVMMDKKRLGRSCGLIGIIKQSLLDIASGVVLYRKVIDYSTVTEADTWFSDPRMHLTEFGKAIGRGQSQEAGTDRLKECVWAEADFASHCRGILFLQK
jgi:hypothetical protein